MIHAVETVLRAEPHKHIATEPKTHCLLTDFKDGDAAVRYWLTDLSQPDPTDSHVRTRIYSALRREGIPLATPMQSIQLTEEDEGRREQRAAEEQRSRLDALGRQELFHALTDDERTALARRLITVHFLRGEVITRQGAEAHWLYIIAEGDANMEVSQNGHAHKVASLSAGSIFGEMSLMTGEPRSASVIATTEVTCYRLEKAAFVDVIQRRPELAEYISNILAQRRVELDAVRDQMSTETKNERVRSMQSNLLRSIKSFFNIG